MAAPLRAVRPGDPISAAKFNEVVDALNALGQLSGVYPIEVQQDAAGVRIGIARQFKAWLFRIQTVPSIVPRTSDNVPYYNATRLRLDNTDTYVAQTPQNVQLYDPLAKDAAAKNLTEGTWVLATFDADTGRWQIVRDPFLGTAIVRFKLTATLALGGSATAVLQNWNAGTSSYTDGATITVVDYFGAIGDPGEWQALFGFYGFAVLLPDKNEYQILYMEQVAEFVAFTLTGNMAAGSATASYDSFWRGRSVGGDGLVYDRQNLYASARSGDKGIACWDPDTLQYVIVDMGRGSASDPVLFYLNATLAQGGSADATLRVWNAGAGAWQATGADVTVWDSSDLAPPAPFDPLPISTLGVAFLSSQSGRYEIIALPASGAVQIVRFKTTTTLSLGGTATAKVQTWNVGLSAYEDGATITVVDFYGSLGRRGKFNAPSGYYGYALKLADKNEWQILDMERVALFAQVTTTEAMGNTTAQEAAATFDVFWQGQDTAGETVVVDSLNVFASAGSGSKFIACYDDFAQQYKILAGPSASSTTWAIAQGNIVLGSTAFSRSHHVSAKRCDSEGNNVDGDPFTVYFHSSSPATEPNVRTGAVFAYDYDAVENLYKATGGDYLDDARGMIKMWYGSASSIPAGWALCDGASYGLFTTPDLSAKFVLSANPGDSSNFDGQGNTADVGATGGTSRHTHDPHQPMPTSSVSLSIDASVETASFGQIPPITFQTEPNMTGSPYAAGNTLGTSLSVETEVETDVTNVVTTSTATFTPNLTGTPYVSGSTSTVSLSASLSGDASVDLGTVSGTFTIEFDVVNAYSIGKGDNLCVLTDGSSPPCAPDGDTISGGVSLTIPPASVDLSSVTVAIEPNPHAHEIPYLPVEGITFSPSTVDLDVYVESYATSTAVSTVAPDPHFHEVAFLPVYGITFSPVSTTIYPTVDIQSYSDIDAAVFPDPHYHLTPTLSHSQAYHIPPYYALCYIMRVN